MFFQRPVYTGVIKLLRDSIGHYGADDVHRYAIIQIGEREIQDVSCSAQLAQHLVEGEQVELELSRVSVTSVLMAAFGILAMFVGDAPELEPLKVAGVIVLIVSCMYVFGSFINAGHVVHSVTVSGQKYTS